MLNRIAKFFSSLRLTVACLLFAIVLVFAGTLAQVKIGLYQAQAEFFRSVFIYWHPAGTDWKIPVFPGGWLLGGVLLINLITAHAKRFEISRKKTGLFFDSRRPDPVAPRPVFHRDPPGRERDAAGGGRKQELLRGFSKK